ncbi:MAG TPA: CCA tRNA nucleotidyltransferase, partial [Bacteroidota bacterium]|nr:CCA tRNA nucleotidyltransferase [Bacteroidota bacterium]
MVSGHDHIDLAEPLLSAIGAVADRLRVEAFVVGGYVRDLLCGIADKDVDILVLGDGIAFAHEVARALGTTTVVEFAQFGTAMVPLPSGKIEFVGARKEHYGPGSRSPAVEPATLEEDLERRDFTVNALAVSLNEATFGRLYDPCNGRADLAVKILRTPRSPDKTFEDDPLRMMRAVRFASQLGFTLRPEVHSALSAMRGRLGIVSQERITDEFMKILASPSPSVGLQLMFGSGILSIVFPEIAQMAGVDQRRDHHHKDVFLHTCVVVDNVARVSANQWLRFAALVHDIAKPRTKAFKEGTGWTFHGH